MVVYTSNHVRDLYRKVAIGATLLVGTVLVLANAARSSGTIKINQEPYQVTANDCYVTPFRAERGVSPFDEMIRSIAADSRYNNEPPIGGKNEFVKYAGHGDQPREFFRRPGLFQDGELVCFVRLYPRDRSIMPPPR